MNRNTGRPWGRLFWRRKGPEFKLLVNCYLKLVIDKRSLLYLLGTELDFTEGLNGKGFLFTNPNASRTCGCGESFGI